MSKKYRKNTKYFYMTMVDELLNQLELINKELGGATYKQREFHEEVQDDIYHTILEWEERNL